MKHAKLLKSRLKKLNSTQHRLVDIFLIMHDTPNMFCEQLRDRLYVQQLSYSEVKRLALSIAPVLSAEFANQRIGIKMQNSYEFIVMFWGIILSGNTPVLLNTEFEDDLTNSIACDLEIKEVFDYQKAKSLCKSVETKLEPLNFDFSAAADEFILTTTGAMGRAKYCFYNGKSIANFINKTPYVLKRIPKIAGVKKIKHLAFLPFYHCFGLFAVYFWFGFFSFPFLFIDNILNDLMQNIRRFKVTHIFAVPLFYKAMYREIFKKVKAKGRLEEFKAGIEKSYRLQSKLPISGKIIRKKFKEVVDNTLGNNVTFMISGGAAIDFQTLQLFNSIGYNLHVGYGMTEVGITSLNLSPDIKSRSTVSIGEPLPNVTYKINQDGVLEIVSDTGAFKVIHGDKVFNLDTNTFYNTSDQCRKEGAIYKFEARNDEIIVAENGENYNLNALQSCNYGFEFLESFCFIPYQNNVAFLISVSGIAAESIDTVIAEVRNNQVLKTKKVSNILVTEQPLRKGLKMINYREIISKITSGELKVFDLAGYTPQSLLAANTAMVQRIKDIVAKNLDLKTDIPENADLFLELGCTSFDYYLIIADLSEAFDISMEKLKLDERGVLDAKDMPRTVLQLRDLIAENIKE